MDNSVSIIFGVPEYGWLPVSFDYQDFHLNFDASDALNDSIDELFNMVTQMQDNEVRRTTWWLEPWAYFFDLEKERQDFKLTINQTNDLHDKSADCTQLISIIGNDKEIIEPFRIAPRQFSSQTYEENHWPFNLDKDKIQSL